MAVDRNIFVDVFGEIVDSMRETGTVTASSEVSGVYTITYSRTSRFKQNTLQNEWHVTIDSVDYQISNLSSTQFQITAATGLDFTGKDWKSLEPYYLYGHPVEITHRLALKDGHQTEKFQKYPLVFLLTDFEESHGESLIQEYVVSPTILIIHKTDKNYIAPERYENVFKPVLYPYYESLKFYIHKSPGLITIDGDLVQHTKTDRLYWGAGGTYGNEGLIFNNHLDAIEINLSDLIISSDILGKCQ